MFICLSGKKPKTSSSASKVAPLQMATAPALPAVTPSVKDTYYSTPWYTVVKLNSQDARASQNAKASKPAKSSQTNKVNKGKRQRPPKSRLMRLTSSRPPILRKLKNRHPYSFTIRAHGPKFMNNTILKALPSQIPVIQQGALKSNRRLSRTSG
ncbi:hypothetical protein EVAR_53004_1 [Eumeta japonica]|uniref:Uncharacterized protein n=1 Tax=Eumeta variegata TaxID=151549 RepID=A0A4C1YMM3_EUMVA|nr:hypothetical protein EVAR_53004_1 [Eumeta japonica]